MATLPGNLTVNIYQGSFYQLKMVYTDVLGVAIDLSAVTDMQMDFRKSKNSVATLLTLTKQADATVDGISFEADGTDGAVLITILAATTDNLDAVKGAVHDLTYVINSQNTPIVSGVANVVKKV